MHFLIFKILKTTSITYVGFNKYGELCYRWTRRGRTLHYTYEGEWCWVG